MSDSDTRLVISLSAEFNLSEASRIARQVEGAIEGRVVTLDFAACRLVDISAVAILARVLGEEGGSLMARGLTPEDHLFLECVGVSLGKSDPHIPTDGGSRRATRTTSR
jgi:anti-anti-sigma regulatory factor